jgi:hypothetical protein
MNAADWSERFCSDSARSMRVQYFFPQTGGTPNRRNAHENQLGSRKTQRAEKNIRDCIIVNSLPKPHIQHVRRLSNGLLGGDRDKKLCTFCFRNKNRILFSCSCDVCVCFDAYDDGPSSLRSSQSRMYHTHSRQKFKLRRCGGRRQRSFRNNDQVSKSAGLFDKTVGDTYPFSRRPVALLFLTVMTGHYRLARLRTSLLPSTRIRRDRNPSLGLRRSKMSALVHLFGRTAG